jgi:hypothetical protein
MVLVNPATVNTMANIKKIVDSITHLISGKTVTQRSDNDVLLFSARLFHHQSRFIFERLLIPGRNIFGVNAV